MSERVGFKRRMPRWLRIVQTLVAVFAGVALTQVALTPTEPLSWRLVCGIGVLISAAAVRTLWAPIVTVGFDGVTMWHRWPIPERVRWDQVGIVDIDQPTWRVVLQLHEGQIVALPCVEELEPLYRTALAQVEGHSAR